MTTQFVIMHGTIPSAIRTTLEAAIARMNELAKSAKAALPKSCTIERYDGPGYPTISFIHKGRCVYGLSIVLCDDIA